MKIFRVEHPSLGVFNGPYRNGKDVESVPHSIRQMRATLSDRHQDAPQHPAWADEYWETYGFDRKWDPEKHLPTALAGFWNEEDFEKWFDDADRALLKANGFSLVEYEVDVDDIWFGTFQVAFKGAGATRIGSVPFS